MKACRTAFCAMACGMLFLGVVVAQDDEEFRPGLVAEYRVGEQVVTRIAPDVAFAWDEAAPDARVSAERFVVWTLNGQVTPRGLHDSLFGVLSTK